LTGYNTSVLYDDGCTLSAGNKTLFPAYFGYPVDPDWQTGSDLAYDNITNAIIPILTVYLPVANVERGGCCNQPKTVLECIRASNFSKGSRVATALAKGTPWSKSGALSAGAKGGVAAGVVVFVLAAGGILLYFWNTKRKKRAAAVLRSDALVSMSSPRTIANKSLMDWLCRKWVVAERPRSSRILRDWQSCPRKTMEETDKVKIIILGKMRVSNYPL
jgi:hypothetical protein